VSLKHRRRNGRISQKPSKTRMESWRFEKPFGSAERNVTAPWRSYSPAGALLSRYIVHVRGEAAFSDRFEERQGPLRCRKCQQYNHKEDRCPNPAACGKCAGNHRVDQCTSDTHKCASWQGTHAVTVRNRPTWDEAWKVIRQREQEMIARLTNPLPYGSQ
jgi:hypothetical protein